MIDLLDGARWRLARTDAGSVLDPGDLRGDLDWIDAVVPGTVATALGDSLAVNPDDHDWWFVADVSTGDHRRVRVGFGGIATRAQIWIDGVHRRTVTSMFVPETLELTDCGDAVTIAVHVESLTAHLKTRRPRGRWRSSLIAAQGLRHERTTMLGRAPVYGPLPVPVGLWRPVSMTVIPDVRRVDLSTAVSGTDGIVTLRADLDAPRVARIIIDDNVFELGTVERIERSVTLPDVELWWPHTHGRPRTYRVALEIDGIVHPMGVVGFRTVELDRAAGGAQLVVNGQTVFCRGGTWTPLDPVRLWSPEPDLREALEGLRSAGLNMVRVVGTLVYEQPEFWSLCAELGIMVWQDVMFGTIDPPTDDTYTAAVTRELDAFAETVSANPALVVVSGGSETQQQPTMLGLAADDQRMVMLDSMIPEFLADRLPAVTYVTSSPSSARGELHTHVGDGIAHYFGVGGYLRPLSDIRTAGVRFAAECLAFAVPPEQAQVEKFFGAAAVAGHHPDWKAAVPRDRGSSWDFEDVRDHYVRAIFGVDPHLIRRDDAELYLDYGRAAIVEAFTEAFGHWRRASSGCGGALVLTLRDTVPGAGWGIVDTAGVPKAPFYALARASAPVALLLSDNGLDGYWVELVNDGPARSGSIRVVLHAARGSHEFERTVNAPANGSIALTVDSIVGTFTDVNHAYRFGSRTYSAVTVLFLDDDGVEVTRTTALVGAQSRQNTVGLVAGVVETISGNWELTVRSDWPAQYVCVDIDGFEVSDSWFHLAPNEPRTLTLVSRGPAAPRGHVRALNSVERASVAPRS
ncbi:beta-mannosidase [Rhodococcus sp. 06-462-5]|uniref:glycoside hydrolase family 2 protein n=1 Tax=unclassified Rhodococcus (in: high G+C Gram-positive bacteria) TaxID=192944 RepID=UPI000B9A6F11|nr:MULTISPECIES: glycoside hydrolase family 2 protein [unclassified Rhodococcus (in: high G+C Gram-positive bacteria)]OZC75319.1 beta-mannosidase [Rhodococcus sp. 06-462-5]OZE67838.1 beta-mannosidase [Rhodococcus sp. 02-925g]